MTMTATDRRPTPLHAAARRGDTTGLAAAPDGVDARMVTGWTPLHDAAAGGHAGAAAELLARGADPSARARDGITPAMVAARVGALDVVRLLVQAGADLTAPADTARTALESALQHGHLDVAKVLVRAGAPVDGPHAVLLLRAGLVAAGRRCRFLEPRTPEGRYTWAVDGPLDVDLELLGLLGPHLASPRLARPSERIPMKAPVDFVSAPDLFAPDEAGERLPSPRWSWRQGWTEHVQAVLHGERDADAPDEFGNLALLDAIRAGDGGVVAALLAADADLAALPAKGCMRGATLLMNAAHEGDAGIVQLLLDAGAAVDDTSPTGWTALMCAAARGHQAVVHALLRGGADEAQRNAQGQTAMVIAQQRGHAAVARSLLVAANVHHLRRMQEPG